MLRDKKYSWNNLIVKSLNENSMYQTDITNKIEEGCIEYIDTHEAYQCMML